MVTENLLLNKLSGAALAGLRSSFENCLFSLGTYFSRPLDVLQSLVGGMVGWYGDGRKALILEIKI